MRLVEKSQVARIEIANSRGTGTNSDFLLANISGYRVGLPYRKKIWNLMTLANGKFTEF